MLTPLGRQIRQLRIDKGVRLKDMAEEFGVKSSFLSAVENGRKSLPKEWLDKLHDYFQGFGVSLSKWKELAELSKPKMSIDLKKADGFDRETCLAFGRYYLDLPAARKRKIRKLLSDD
jgi:HTH-type transcriptional regulator, competence development regulator